MELKLLWSWILMILPMCQAIFVYLNMFLDPGISERVLWNHPWPSMVSLSIHSPSVHLLVHPSVGPSFCWSFFRYLRDHPLAFPNFGPHVLLRGSLVIALDRLLFVVPSVVRPSVVRWSVFKYLRDRSLVFLILDPEFTQRGP